MWNDVSKAYKELYYTSSFIERLEGYITALKQQIDTDSLQKQTKNLKYGASTNNVLRTMERDMNASLNHAVSLQKKYKLVESKARKTVDALAENYREQTGEVWHPWLK